MRKTFAQVRKEAAEKARVEAIEECCRVLKHFVGNAQAAEELYKAMSMNDFKREKKRERHSTAWFMKMTPDEYFGTN